VLNAYVEREKCVSPPLFNLSLLNHNDEILNREMTQNLDPCNALVEGLKPCAS